MRIAYVSGPYRADCENGVWEHIAAARVIAVKLWQMGYAVICPHTNTAFFGTGAEHDGRFLEGDLAIIDRLIPGEDCLVMMPTWQHSAGAQGEMARATFRGLDVYFWPDVPNSPHLSTNG